jgi:hypothetical protein
MAKKANGRSAPVEVIQNRIFLLRGCRVMLDCDLAEIYGVETRVLNQAVKRNTARFPKDFMFRVTTVEVDTVLLSRSQTVMLKRGKNVKHLPHVFTEHGAIMLANVLKSKAAIRASIRVVRAFMNLRQSLAISESLARKISAIEDKLGHHDAELDSIFSALRTLLNPPEDAERAKRPIGFLPPPER